MPKVELLFSSDCPNVSRAREQLRRALEQAALPLMWQEHCVDAPDAPEHVRAYGSPTILVDGVDVDSQRDAGGTCCRVYSGSDLSGAPSLQTLLSALQAKSPR